MLEKFKEAELTQYLKLVGGGPSLKTCPKCESQLAHKISILSKP